MTCGLYDRGGFSTVMENLAEKLADKGHEVTIGALLFKRFPSKGAYRVVRIPIANPLKLRVFLQSFDVVHNHHPITNYLALMSCKPFVYHYHGVPNFGSGYLFWLSAISSIKLMKNAFDAVVAISETGAAELNQYSGLNDVHVVYNGVDTNLFKPGLGERFREGKPQFLFVGNLYDYKNVAEVLFGFKEVLNSFPKAHLQIIGSGHSHAKLSKLACKLSLHGNIEFIGPIDNSKLPDYYNSCDVYVTSSKSENFSLPLLEAWACGKTVVASAIPAHIELIHAANAGLTYELGNVKDLGQKMIEASYLGFSNSANHGVQFAEANTWSCVADQMERIYSSIGCDNLSVKSFNLVMN